MGVEVEDVEGDKKLQWSRENGRLSQTHTQHVCSWLCVVHLST